MRIVRFLCTDRERRTEDGKRKKGAAVRARDGQGMASVGERQPSCGRRFGVERRDFEDELRSDPSKQRFEPPA